MSPLDWALLPLQQYVTFQGRAPRAEYWWFTLLTMSIGVLCSILDLALGLGTEEAPIGVGMLMSLFFFLTSLSVTARRLHDTNRSGWKMLIWFLPSAAAFALFVTPFGWVMLLASPTFALLILAGAVLYTFWKFIGWMATEGSRGPNEYGPSPYGYSYGL